MPLLSIEIPWSPDALSLGGLVLTWHGVFTAAGILVGLAIAARLARGAGIADDNVWTLALVAVPAGIVGARVLFVAEHWGYYSDRPGEVIALAQGGMSAWGAVIGGAVGMLAVAAWREFPAGRAFDVASVSAAAGLAVGRIGGVISGEHLGRVTDLPWGVIYTHPQSPAYAYSLTVGTHHPVAAYELLANLALAGALVWLLRSPRWRPGMTFVAFLVLYSWMRLGFSELRLDSAPSAIGLTAPQLVAIGCLLVAGPVAYAFWRSPAVAAIDQREPELAAARRRAGE